MTETLNPVVTLSRLDMEHDSTGSVYESRDASVSRLLALTRLGCSYTEVPPGKSSCPFHVHHAEDEMFVLLEGEGEYRFGDMRHQVRAGDVLGAPVGGPEYAHQLFNTGDVPLKYLAISSKAEVDVCEYPDSGKYAVTSRKRTLAGKPYFRVNGRVENSLDYWDGEDIGEQDK